MHGTFVPQQRYLDALRADLDATASQAAGRTISSIYVGGGTPNLLAPDALGALLEHAHTVLSVAQDCEISMEANPGVGVPQRLRDFRAAGVNRLSLGVQSFDDTLLARIGRVHDAAQARDAAAEAARTFGTWNLDLMIALPGQSLDGVRSDLHAALEWGAPHMSVYTLTIEAHTPFAKNPPTLPDADRAADMHDLAIDLLGAQGLDRYEVSAFARDGHACQHNRNYWQFGDYLGIGAGAHGKRSQGHHVVRQTRLRNPERYMEHALQGRAVAQERIVPAADLPFEFLLNALRLTQGFAVASFEHCTGHSIRDIEPQLETAVRQGWMVYDGTQAQPTRRGLDFLSDLQSLFLPTT